MTSNEKYLDVEFKRYLQILKPYLAQLSDHFIINNCNVWIQKLSERNDDKVLRNKYIYGLFSNLARGYLDMPFLIGPPNILPPLHDDLTDSESSSAECLVINPDEPSTRVIFDRKYPLASETGSQDDEKDIIKENSVDKTTSSEKCDQTTVYQPNLLSYTCPEFLFHDKQGSVEEYDNRAASLLRKVREIKTQNVILQNELLTLRGDYGVNNHEFATIVDNSTNPYVSESHSNIAFTNLKCKFQEMKYTRNSLIDTIDKLQDQLNNFELIKRHEIDELEAKHKLEIINIKTAVHDEIKEIYEKKIDKLKQSYEVIINEIKEKSHTNDTVTEQNKSINEKDMELDRLRLQLEDQKKNLQSILSKLIQNPNDDTKDNNLKMQIQQYEKQLNKLEKSKLKCTKVYEMKLASLQRDKHLAECSLHLQLVKQRAQVLSEVADENQTDLATALNNLEIKYKDIIANVQASTMNRRMQDQIALESILQAACGFQTEISRGTNSQFSGKTFRNPHQSGDTENWTVPNGNKVENKCFYDDGLLTGQCLDGEKFGQLFERHIPQRDSGH